MARYYIHTCKCNETDTSAEGVEQFIRSTIKREKSIAKINNELPKLLRKWDKFAGREEGGQMGSQSTL